MDFFAQQDRARRNTRLLVVLFILAVVALIFLVNALVTAFFWFSEDYNLYTGSRRGLAGYLEAFSWERFGAIGLAITATVVFISFLRWLQLAAGGKTIAEGMGGRRVLRQSIDLDEVRCLNVVEELALAANMPVPALYVMPDERGINAFAAGITPADAVVAVTRGTILQLKRDELQGVIGHEFSHILNGDMRLGIRLAALLKGITFIGDVGHFLLRSGSRASVLASSRPRSQNTALLPILGLALLVFGWLGSLAAGFIKAAISRQKEYLADASAVQFTRDNEGIANALKVIGGFLPGSLVHAARAEEMSHIFFGEVRHQIWNAFSTHPPLEERIQRLDAQWNGKFIERKERRYATGPLTEDMASIGVGREALVLAAAASVGAGAMTGAGAAAGEGAAADGNVKRDANADDGAIDDHTRETPLHEEPEDLQGIAPDVLKAAEDPLGATAIALAMLLARDSQSQEQCLALIEEQGVQGQAAQVAAVLPGVGALTPGQRFPLIASAMPALKSLSTPQYRQFKSTLLLVIRADRRTDLFEWCLFQLLRHYLDPEYLRVAPSRPRYSHLGKVRGPLRQVLSVLAYQGEGSSEEAFATAIAYLDMGSLKLQPLEECSIASFSEAVHTLADCYPLLKPRILKAMALAAADDGNICNTEREIVAAVAAVMDCPPPDELALHTG